MNIHEKINHSQEVLEKSVFVKAKGSFGVDINRYGVRPYMDDCENCTIFRETLYELSVDTRPRHLDHDDEYCEPHYPNANYESIFDY